MDRTPDLSHLTIDEKKIIQAVIDRQHAEERLDAGDIDDLDEHDYSSPSIAFTSRQYSLPNQSGVCCQICHQNLFINEQSSRQCSICYKRFCNRCGIRSKCNQCRIKPEQYFTSQKNISKQYLSDYILSQTTPSDDHQMIRYGANEKRIPPKLKSLNITGDDEEENNSSESMIIRKSSSKKRLLPEIRKDLLREYQYHSLEERDLGQESTLKDSGIDTASSSTILNLISSEKFHQPMTYWRWNDTRTEQIGYIYLKNPFPKFDYEHGKISLNEIFTTLGLQIQTVINEQNELRTEITHVIPGSIADTYGQLKVGDQILEWNGDKLENNDVNRILSQISIQSTQIHLIVKRLIRINSEQNYSIRLCQDVATIEKISLQLQYSFHNDQKQFHVMIYTAKNLPIQHGLVACQLSLQDRNDTLSKIEKCTKAQPCTSGMCIWNQRIIFFDLNSIDQMNLWIKLINLEVHQEILGEIHIEKLNSTNKSEWYTLTDQSFNRNLSSMADIPICSPSTTNHRKRQLPDIPQAQLHANRERVSQDLFQKATELKLRLHMQSTSAKSLPNQRSFDQRQNRTISQPRNSMINLPTSKNSSMINLKDKPKIPMIREKSAPNSTSTRRTTMIPQSDTNIGKSKLKSLEEKYRKTIKKQHSLETPGDELDSDGFESTINSKQLTRSRYYRPQSVDHFDQIQLNDEELRQMEMRSYETAMHSLPINTTTKIPNHEMDSKTSLPSVISIDKVNPRTDGTISDSALSTQSEPSIKRRASKQSKAFVILGLSKKANSSATLGGGRRSGFQRSEEIGVQPHLRNRALERQTSKENEKPISAPAGYATKTSFNTPLHRDQYHSMPDDIKLWSGALKLPHEHPFTDFIEGLGVGQLVGRQVLASPCHGEIQIGLREQHGVLEVEIVRARNLPQKIVYKTPPAPYVKVYLLDGKTCLEKQRTRITRRTFDPLIQQTLIFKEDFQRKILQISVWGDYGKLDRKVFMGVCQIGLNEVNLNSSQQILDWYKLFSANSLLNNYTIVQQSSKINSHNQS